MHSYKVHLPQSNHWNDEFDSWIEQSYSTGKVKDNLDYNEDEDFIGLTPNGSYMDDKILVDNKDITIV
jgi:hypothetical protein